MKMNFGGPMRLYIITSEDTLCAKLNVNAVRLDVRYGAYKRPKYLIMVLSTRCFSVYFFNSSCVFYFSSLQGA